MKVITKTAYKGGSGGGSHRTEYVQSPEQRQLLAAVQPGAERIGYAAEHGLPLYDVPELPDIAPPDAPELVSAQGVYTGAPLYDIPAPIMPSREWYENLAPQIRAGLFAPYEEAAEGTLERMGAAGQIGSARAGFSGAAGAALGKMASQASKDVALMAWQMTAPQMEQYRQEHLRRAQFAHGLVTRERETDYFSAIERQRATDARNLALWEQRNRNQMAVWQAGLQSRQMPYQAIPNLVGQGMPSAVVTGPGVGGGGTNWGGMATGALSGAAAGSMIMPGWGTAAGAVIGGIGGLFG